MQNTKPRWITAKCIYSELNYDYTQESTSVRLQSLFKSCFLHTQKSPAVLQLEECNLEVTRKLPQAPIHLQHLSGG